jgi:hypothetical protein
VTAGKTLSISFAGITSRGEGAASAAEIRHTTAAGVLVQVIARAGGESSSFGDDSRLFLPQYQCSAGQKLEINCHDTADGTVTSREAWCDIFGWEL